MIDEYAEEEREGRAGQRGIELVGRVGKREMRLSINFV